MSLENWIKDESEQGQSRKLRLRAGKPLHHEQHRSSNQFNYFLYQERAFSPECSIITTFVVPNYHHTRSQSPPYKLPFPRLLHRSPNMAKLADPGLLDKIDKLFECNVGHYIDLPQLVVVGDQSSGKSSVLQGLTDLPFPRDSGLCTRFATQIIFRRAAEARVSVRIIPSKGADQEHAAKTRAWSKQGLKNLGQESFGKIMQEVCCTPLYLLYHSLTVI